MRCIKALLRHRAIKSGLSVEKKTRAGRKYIEVPDLKNLQERAWRLASHRQ